MARAAGALQTGTYLSFQRTCTLCFKVAKSIAYELTAALLSLCRVLSQASEASPRYRTVPCRLKSYCEYRSKSQHQLCGRCWRTWTQKGCLLLRYSWSRRIVLADDPQDLSWWRTQTREEKKKSALWPHQQLCHQCQTLHCSCQFALCIMCHTSQSAMKTADIATPAV